jgi:hypothetical protein
MNASSEKINRVGNSKLLVFLVTEYPGKQDFLQLRDIRDWRGHLYESRRLRLESRGCPSVSDASRLVYVACRREGKRLRFVQTKLLRRMRDKGAAFAVACLDEPEVLRRLRSAPAKEAARSRMLRGAGFD